MISNLPLFALGGWPLFIATILGSLGLGGLLKTWLDYRSRARKQTDDMASQVVSVTMGRLKAVERHAIICDANLAYARHKAANIVSTFDSMLMLMEVAPEKQTEIIGKLKEKRARDEESEAVERAAILAAAIASAGEDEAGSDVIRAEVAP